MTRMQMLVGRREALDGISVGCRRDATETHRVLLQKCVRNRYIVKLKGGWRYTTMCDTEAE
jgi:hypothetical protein